MSRLIVFLALIFLTATPSAACSVKEGYKTPTNFELVRQASVIVLARVKNAPTADEAGNGGMIPGVVLEPIRFLKGAAPAGELKVIGWRAPGNWSGVPNATTLSQSHFSAGLGACVRQFYEPGELVVAMFEPNSHRDRVPDLQFVQPFNPFSREVETVDGPDDVWVHAVEKYVALQEGPSAQLDERVKAAIQELRTTHTVEAQAMAEDLDWYLSRTEKKGVWGNFSTPMSTLAVIAGYSGVGLACFAGTAPVVLIEGKAPTSVQLVVNGASFQASRTSLSAFEKQLLAPDAAVGKNDQTRSLLRFENPTGLLAAAKSAVEPAEIKVDGKTHGTGRPLDALYRWASQCKKLQKLPVPTEKEMG